MQVLGPRALICVALRGPPLLPMSPGCHQEELGVTWRAAATGSLASMNLFELRLGALSETPQRTICINWPCLVSAKLARIDEDDQEGAILVREEQGFMEGCLWMLCCHCMQMLRRKSQWNFPPRPNHGTLP